MVKHTFGSTAADNKKETTKEKEAADDLDMRTSSAQIFPPACQSLVSPKTLLSGTAVSLGGGAVIIRNGPSPHRSNGLVLCSTTVSCLSSPDHLGQNSAEREAPRLAGEEEHAEVFHLETVERCGSYDDVVLEGDGDIVSGESGFNYAADFDGNDYLWEASDDAASSLENVRGTVSENMLKPQRRASKAAVTSLAPKTISPQVNMWNSVNEIWQQSKLVKADSQACKLKQLNTGLKTSMKGQEKSKLAQRNSNTNTRCSFARPKAAASHLNQTPKSSFSIYTDKPSGESFCPPKPVLTSLSANIHKSKSDCSLKRVQRVTSPLCSCGRRAKRQVVSNGGPNNGRGFYCCAVRRPGGPGRIQKGCEFFKWESAVMKSSSVASAAASSSVSLCQVNSSRSRRPTERPSRKSC